jgi:hypothetical protein
VNFSRTAYAWPMKLGCFEIFVSKAFQFLLTLLFDAFKLLKQPHPLWCLDSGFRTLIVTAFIGARFISFRSIGHVQIRKYLEDDPRKTSCQNDVKSFLSFQPLTACYSDAPIPQIPCQAQHIPKYNYRIIDGSPYPKLELQF